jgi:high-affinity iron transporter
MIPTLLITMREVIEASLIVATILGILTKLHRMEERKNVWVAAILALAASFLLVMSGSFIGLNARNMFDGPAAEGIIYILSALFVTWAVFFLHTQFAHKKMQLLSRLRETIAGGGIFVFTFITVFREGVEISLFLSTLYITNSPVSIAAGFIAGAALGVFISFLFFRATIRLPVYWAFRITSLLLILFAGNLLAQGVQKILEITPFTVATNIQTLPLIAAISYIYLMHRRVFVRSR